MRLARTITITGADVVLSEEEVVMNTEARLYFILTDEHKRRTDTSSINRSLAKTNHMLMTISARQTFPVL